MEKRAHILTLIFLVAFWSIHKGTLGNPLIQIQSYRRHAIRAPTTYLKYHLDSEGNPTHVAFNGAKDDPNTVFELRKGVKNRFPYYISIRPEKNTSYALAVENNKFLVQYIGTSPTSVTEKNSFRALSLCSRFVRCHMVRLYSLQSEHDVRRQYITTNYCGTTSVSDCVDDRGTWLIIKTFRSLKTYF